MAIHITEQAVTTPDGRLFVRVWTPAGAAHGQPTAPICPFVLLHDSLGSVDLWRDFPEALAQATGKPVVAYDRLGYGRSDAAHGLPPADFVAQEGQAGLKPVLDQLQLQRAILLGHSVGGGMAVNGAVQMPERIAGIVTVAAQAFAEDRTLEAIAQAKLQFQDESQLARLRKYHGDKARWVVDAWTESWLSPAFASWHVRDVLAQLQCPLLALHGEHDEYGSAVHPQIYSEGAGGPSHMMLIPGAHHLPHREQPLAVAQWVQDFVREHGL
jgi:pimeloyl-ACP methyl ester carboxylesterase